MNTVFVALGVAAVVDGWRCLPAGLRLHTALLVLFGIGLLGAAAFHHAPLPAGAPVDVRYDELHSGLSGLVGASFVAFAVASGFGDALGRDR